jgi:hypothetical protein
MVRPREVERGQVGRVGGSMEVVEEVAERVITEEDADLPLILR